MKDKVIVAGVGMVPFAKPGASESYSAMGAKAVRQAGPEGARPLRVGVAEQEIDPGRGAEIAAKRGPDRVRLRAKPPLGRAAHLHETQRGQGRGVEAPLALHERHASTFITQRRQPRRAGRATEPPHKRSARSPSTGARVLLLTSHRRGLRDRLW